MRRIILIICASVLLLGGVAYASIPDAGGVIHGCRKNTDGSVRVIDTDAGQTCANGWTPLNWDSGHIHYQWTREVEVHTGPVLPNGGGQALALCPSGEVALGGSFLNRDPQNLTVTHAGDFMPMSKYPQGYEVFAVAGPNGSQHPTGVTAHVTCGKDPDA